MSEAVEHMTEEDSRAFVKLLLSSVEVVGDEPKPRIRVKAGSRKVGPVARMEPLGAEFERVWDENIEQLYEP